MKFRDLFRPKTTPVPEPVTPAATEPSPTSAARVDEMLQESQALLSAGRLPEATAAFRSVLALDPENWAALNALASIALQRGDLSEAIERYSALLARRPDFAEGYYKRGNAYNRSGALAEALADYDQAVTLDPKYAYAFCNRGTVLERLKRWSDALASYDRAVELNPLDAFAYYNRASVLRELERLDEALTSYDRAIALNSGYVEAYVNRGHLLHRLQRHESAAASYDKVLELCPLPTHATGQSITLRPEQRHLLGLRQYVRMQICDWQNLHEHVAQIAAGLRQKLPVVQPFPTLALLDDPSLQRAAAESWIQTDAPPNPALGPIAARPRSSKIRVGYFSADFRIHPVAYLTAGLFEQHDRSKFEFTAFSLGPRTNDTMQTRIAKAFDRFLDVRESSDTEIAALARSLGIDIAVNLNGITEHSRTGIFALRAAPVQVSYLGYAGTMGAPFIDYLIADAVVIPRARQRDYLEKIVYLPDCFMPFDSGYSIAERIFTRAELGLPPTALVFCCFNNIFKVTPDIFDVWMRLLSRHGGSVLWLPHTNSSGVANLQREASKRGIEPGRLVFARRTDSLPEHLARIRAADLFLDTFPYNAHTTGADALWAGVPVLTYSGESFASRVAGSLLQAVGLPQLVTRSPSEYEDLATRLAADPERLRQMRASLAQNRETASLFNTSRYVKNIEAAYEAVYERHLSGLAPGHIGAPAATD